MGNVSRTRGNLWICRYFFFDEDFLLGTLAPAFRASDSRIAIACFLLVTFLPDRPLFRVPFFFSCIAFSTFSDAFLPYWAMFVPPRIICIAFLPRPHVYYQTR